MSDSSVTLHLKDCLDVMRTLPDGCVDAVVTDPPFSSVTHRGARSRTNGAQSKALVSFDSINGEQFLQVVNELVRLSRRWVVMFCDWRHAALLEPAGLPLVRLGVWIKPNSAPQLTGDRPATGWESIAFLHRPGKKKWNGGGKRGVWTCNRVNAVHHPTEKPVSLVSEMIRLFTDETDTVLDPFMGSGTTGVACLNTGRRFIGVEQDPGYFAAAERRINEARNAMPLFAGAPA